MKKILLIMALLVSSCKTLEAPEAAINAKAVAPLWNIVLARYDNYVWHDPTLDDNKKGAWLLDGNLLKKILEEAMGGNKDSGE